LRSSQGLTFGTGIVVQTVAATWLRIGAPGLGDALLSDPILVLGPQGTSAVPRGAFLAAVAGREATANAADTAATLTATTVTPLTSRFTSDLRFRLDLAPKSYGFTVGMNFDWMPDRAELIDQIRSFLAEIDPKTGYLPD